MLVFQGAQARVAAVGAAFGAKASAANPRLAALPDPIAASG